MNLEEKFWKGHQALLDKRYKTAKDCFLSIIVDKEANSFQYQSGSYVNLARATFELAGKEKNNDASVIDIIKEYLLKALEIKPNNQAALAFSVTIYSMTKEFDKVIDYYLKINDPTIRAQSFVYLGLLEPLILNKDNKVLYALPSIEKLYASLENNPRIVNIMANAYMAKGEFTKSYFVLRKYLEGTSERNSTETVSLYNTLILLCSTALNKPEEAIEYAHTCLDIINSAPAYRQKEFETLSEYVNSNLALTYGSLHKYEKVIELLTPKLQRNPNNTDYFNLANAHFRLKDYEMSLKLLEKALFILKDEQSLYIAAENYYYLGKYKEALSYYKNAVSFLNLVDNHKVSFTDANNQELVSSVFNSEKTTRDIYIGLIQCYIAMEDYISAKAATSLIKEKWLYDDELIKIEKNIELFLSKQKVENEIKQKVTELNAEIEQQRKAYEKEISEVRDWALNLIKLQNRCVKENDEINLNEADWRVIMKQMHEIALEMRESILVDSKLFDNYKRDFKTAFPKISDEALTFLSTGEFLYQVHQSSHLDFAPIMVEFSKVVEVELNRLFLKKRLRKKNNFLTLGQLRHTINTMKISNLPNLDDFLDTIVTYRNGSAHTGSSTKEKVEKVRALILDKGWLKLILEAI
jgi:tetratricopeptide (TPR) repeat protein